MSESKTADGANSRGIPQAHFVEDVEAHLATCGKPFDQVMAETQELYGKFKFMEQTLVGQKKRTLEKIPDIRNALATVRALRKRKDEGGAYETEFKLADQVYAKAQVSDENDTVFIWLGANTMLEYGYEEAETLLARNLEGAKEQLATLTEDLGFLKDQITVSEVCVARLHNHGVKLRRELQQASARAGAGKA